MRGGHFEDRGRGRGKGRGGHRDWAGRDAARDGGLGDDKNKRTLTDFRISGLDIPDLDWSWRAENMTPAQKADEDIAETKVRKKPFALEREELTAGVQGKHKREEDEAEERLLISEVKGKKSKSDADVIKQEEDEAAAALLPPASKSEAVVELQPDADGSSPTPTAEQDEATPTATEGVLQSSEAVMEKADEEASSKGTPSPEKALSHASPNVSANRENSRLRIYFSSPVTEPRATCVHPLPTAPSNRSASVRSASISRENVVQLQQDGYGETGFAQAEAQVAATPVPPADVDGEALAEPAPDVHQEVTASEVVTAIEPEEGKALDEQESAQPVIHPAQNGDGSSGDVDGEDVKPAEPDSRSTIDPSQYPPEPSAVDVGEDVKPIEFDSRSTREPSQYPPEPYPPVESSENEMGSRYATPGFRPDPAPDRISISYARNTRRIVVDVDVVERVRIHRVEGKVEVTVNLIPPDVLEGGRDDDFRLCKGVLVRRAFVLYLQQ
jgi:hypothetical protein